MSETPKPEVSAVVAAVAQSGRVQFEQSPEIGKLALALSKAQVKFPTIVKDRTAKIPGKDGKPGYTYRYADLASIIAATYPELEKNELGVTQQLGSDKATGDVLIRTQLSHSSGQWIASIFPMPGGSTPQTKGSAATYARRYALSAILGVATEDDDGSAATHGEDTSEPGGPIRPPPSQAQPLPPGRQLTGFKVPASFKNNGGKDLAELEAKELSSLADYFLKASQDPKKQAYAAQNKALHDACVLESLKREGK